MLKNSKQRQSIQAFLITRTDHPTAETVYSHIRQEIPNISLATVYRNLALLTELGQIQKIRIDDGPDRFDGNTSVHDHFICRSCNAVIDVPAPDSARIDRTFSRSFDGRVEGHRTYFYGQCRQCLEGGSQMSGSDSEG